MGSKERNAESTDREVDSALSTLHSPPSTSHPPLSTFHPPPQTCGACTRCLDVCPTQAFPEPHVLDARRCISYLTIELKGPIPHELRPAMGNWIFGCDLCQVVCPWNRRFARPARLAAFRPRPDMTAPKLLDLLALDEDGFRRRFRNSPVQRAKRRGLLRNVCVALGNWGDPLAVPGLVEALNDSEPLIRGHAAWALGQIGQRPEVRGQKAEVRGQRSDVGGVIWKALKTRHASELDGFVQNEINHALALFSPETLSNTNR